jgi:hypothetical protein
MAEKCHKIQDIDLALFLLEPHGSEWQEFRAHYPQCVTCSAELQRWTSLEHRLRSMANTGATRHPSAETLVQFQQKSDLLSPEAHETIATHVSTCVTCREEVKLLGSFDPSRISQWANATKTPVLANERESWSTRLWNMLRPLFPHPAFAVGLVLLLSAPFMRAYYLSSFNQAPISPDIAPTSAPAPAIENAQVRQTPAAQLEERQEVEPPPQIASVPTSRPESPAVALAPPVIGSIPEAEKAKENVQPAQLAKRSARREDFAYKDERTPPPPASPAPSRGAEMSMRDEQGMLQQKNHMGAEEKKQQTFSELQKPTQPTERETRSTEGPLAEQRRRTEGSLQMPATASAPAQTAARIRGNSTPQDRQLQTALSALTEKYKQAYEARDIHSLRLVWNMDQPWQEALTQFFAKNQQISVMVTLDESNSIASADQRQVSVPLTQFVTTVTNDGQTSTHGPFYCLADIRKQNTGQWKIYALQEDAQHPGQCRIQ